MSTPPANRLFSDSAKASLWGWLAGALAFFLAWVVIDIITPGGAALSLGGRVAATASYGLGVGYYALFMAPVAVVIGFILVLPAHLVLNRLGLTGWVSHLLAGLVIGLLLALVVASPWKYANINAAQLRGWGLLVMLPAGTAVAALMLWRKRRAATVALALAGARA